MRPLDAYTSWKLVALKGGAQCSSLLGTCGPAAPLPPRRPPALPPPRPPRPALAEADARAALSAAGSTATRYMPPPAGSQPRIVLPLSIGSTPAFACAILSATCCVESVMRVPLRSGRLLICTIILPVASHSCSSVPKFDVGTMYENGLSSSVTRNAWPSGDGLTP